MTSGREFVMDASKAGPVRMGVCLVFPGSMKRRDTDDGRRNVRRPDEARANCFSSTNYLPANRFAQRPDTFA
jgi:hypothetical protein